MIVHEIMLDFGQVRVFCLRTAPGNDWQATAEAEYWDEDDRVRCPLLRELLGQPVVLAVAYPTIGHRDVLQVFLRAGNGELIFACVVVSLRRLRAMLEADGHVVEGFALQVAPGEHLTNEGIRAALQAWVERAFPGVPLPVIALEVWAGENAIREDLLELHLAAAGDPVEDAVEELEPSPEIADPPYEDAA